MFCQENFFSSTKKKRKKDLKKIKSMEHDSKNAT